MPSLVPGYEYDVFISYRQNDNRSGWVTTFVHYLNEELAASFKRKVSVYFDAGKNDDALLETHDVDESLRNKLRCVIFIPVISQTYCDENSFAWKNELLPFIAHAESDKFGLKVRLANGNVMSRVLPVRIHEIDTADETQINEVLKGTLRPVDFIYRSTGVVRPLLDNEIDPKSNTDHIYYRDQVNKVVRSIKDLLYAMNEPAKAVVVPETVPRRMSRKLAIVSAIVFLLALAVYFTYSFTDIVSPEPTDKSIAVLPFENMNKDSAQDYFSNGMTEDILNHLVKVSDLKVRSRTSTLAYKGSGKSAGQIGQELQVSNIVEGSVRRVGDRVRIVVQLVDTRSDLHLWSETYDRDLQDILSLQSEIAIEIANALKAQLSEAEQSSIAKEVSHNITAYDYFMRAREIMNTYGGDQGDLNSAMMLVNEAIRLDPQFSKPYALKGRIWQREAYFGVSEKMWVDSSMHFGGKAIELDPFSADGYLVQVGTLHFLGKIEEGDRMLERMIKADPNHHEGRMRYGWKLLRDKKEEGADIILEAIENQFRVQDPQYYVQLSDPYYFAGDIDGLVENLKKALSLEPASDFVRSDLAFALMQRGSYQEGLDALKLGDQNDPSIIDQTALLNYFNKNYTAAASGYEKYKLVESRYEDSTQSIPFRHRLAMTYVQLGRKVEADQLIIEHEKILRETIAGKRSKGTWMGLGAIYYDYALCQSYLGKKEAAASLDSAFEYGFRVPWFYHNDPLLEPLKNDEGYKRVLAKLDDWYAFRKKAFSGALNRAEASRKLKLNRAR